MVRLSVIALCGAALAAPAQAASKKEVDCGHQAAVVGAVQQARLERVGERKVSDYVRPRATWPDRYNTAIPLVTPWVYEMRMKDVRTKDLGAAWNEMCLAQ